MAPRVPRSTKKASAALIVAALGDDGDGDGDGDDEDAGPMRVDALLLGFGGTAVVRAADDGRDFAAARPNARPDVSATRSSSGAAVSVPMICAANSAARRVIFCWSIDAR